MKNIEIASQIFRQMEKWLYFDLKKKPNISILKKCKSNTWNFVCKSLFGSHLNLNVAKHEYKH